MRHDFRLNIHYLFIYLFKAMSTKTGGTDDLYLLMEITCCETWFSFEYSLSIYLFIQSDVNKSRWKQRPLFTYGNELYLHMVFVLILSIYLFI